MIYWHKLSHKSLSVQMIGHGHTFCSDLHLAVTFDHSLASHSSLVSLSGKDTIDS